METKTFWNRTRNKLMTPVAVVGIIFVLAFGTWVTVTAVRSAPSAGEFFVGEFWKNINAALVSLSSIFVPAEQITVAIEPTEAKSGMPVTLVWEHRGKRDTGTYTFHYPCVENFNLETIEKVTVACGVELSIEGRKTIVVVPRYQGEPAEITLTIAFSGQSEKLVSGTTRLLVTEDISMTPTATGSAGGKKTVVAGTPSPVVTQPTKKETFTAYDGVATATTGARTEKTYTVTTPAPPTQNGLPDLAVKILAVGIIDPQTNIFTATSTVKANERAAVRFEIVNLGGKSSGAWRFNTVLPTFPHHIFHSEEEHSLAPGDKIEFTLGFDQIDPGITLGTITINADPTSSIKESDENNNLGKAVIEVSK